jgi:hypothetical protein
MSNEGGSGCGCFLLIFLLWLVFTGVTIDGRHYGLDCDFHRGISFESPSPY